MPVNWPFMNSIHEYTCTTKNIIYHNFGGFKNGFLGHMLGKTTHRMQIYAQGSYFKPYTSSYIA